MKQLLFPVLMVFVLFTQGQGSVANELFSISSQSTPGLGETQSSFLGENMITKRTGQYLPCLEFNVSLKKEFSSAFMKGIQVINKGDLFCKRGSDRLYWQGFGLSVGMVTPFPAQVGFLELKEGKKTSKACFQTAKCFKKLKNDIFNAQFDRVDKFIVEGVDSFQHSIEYSGKDGSILTFTYYANPNNWTRDSVTREFKMDLDSSNVGGFKGAIFEVINADNVQVQYKVIRHFK